MNPKYLISAKCLSVACIAWLALGTAQAQPAQSPTQASPQTATTEATKPPTDKQESLIQAFQREFAFLEVQKKQLQQDLVDTKTQQARELQQQEKRLARLEQENLRGQARLEKLNHDRLTLQQRVEAGSNRKAGFKSTMEQAVATLKDAGAPPQLAGELPANEKARQLLAQMHQLLQRQSRVQLETGPFFLADGTRTEGKILQIGSIASVGASARGAGVLVPAGDGQLKIWPRSNADKVRTLIQAAETGSAAPIQSLPLYLYESTRHAVEEQDEKSLYQIIEDGGIIAWVIVALGLLALLLVVLRIFFLYRASASINRVARSIGERVRQGQVEAAMAQCKHSNSAICRVILATLRNLDRDREHLEDIISEAILHESVFLNRFATPIMVVAAVAPLLGLLGTVTGMISTFDIITEFGTGDPKLLSSGISIALITTEIGLVVAIPALIAGNLLSSWADNIKTDTERAALKVMNLYQDYLLSQKPAPDEPPGLSDQAKAA